MGTSQPVFPIIVRYSDGSVVLLKDEEMVALYGPFTHWYDSSDKELNNQLGIERIEDSLGRSVRLIVKHLEIVQLDISE